MQLARKVSIGFPSSKLLSSPWPLTVRVEKQWFPPLFFNSPQFMLLSTLNEAIVDH